MTSFKAASDRWKMLGWVMHCCLLLPLLFYRPADAAAAYYSNQQSGANVTETAPPTSLPTSLLWTALGGGGYSATAPGGWAYSVRLPAPATAWRPPLPWRAVPSPVRRLQLNANRTPGGRAIPGLAKHSQCCGRENDDARILGGFPAQKNQYPWMASIVEQNTYLTRCTGFLINNLYVGTTGFCLFASHGGHRHARNRYRPPTYEILLGRYEQNSDSGNEMRLEIGEVIIHPDFDIATTSNDIALVKLTAPLNLPIGGNVIAPICLPSRGSYTNRRAVIAGWGYITESEDLPERLYDVSLRTMSNTFCSSLLLGNSVKDTHICAGDDVLSAQSKDFCLSDTGGPLMVSPWYRPSRRSVVGIASGSNYCKGPANTVRFGVYTRLTEFLDWMLDNMEDATYC